MRNLKYVIGQRIQNNKGLWLTIVEELEKNSFGHRRFIIEFDEINEVKYRTIVTATKKNIMEAKNPFAPSLCGVGYMGNINHESSKHLYYRWANIVRRCYQKNSVDYHKYGAKGVTVCKRWHSLENFVHDFSLLEGYDEKNIKKLDLDKDSKIPGNKIYSPETCVLMSKIENAKEMNNRAKQKWFKAISPMGKEYVSKNQKQFAIEHDLRSNSINEVLKNKFNHHKGWSFEYIDE